MELLLTFLMGFGWGWFVMYIWNTRWAMPKHNPKLRIVKRASPFRTRPTYVVQYRRRGKWIDRHAEYPTKLDAEGSINDILTRDLVVKDYP